MRRSSRASSTDGTPEQVADALAQNCLAMRLRMLNRVVAGAYETALRPLDLTPGQITLLAALTKSGPLTQSQLASKFMLEKSTLSRNVQRMVQRDWVAEEPGETGNSKLLRISRAGRRVLQRAFPLWQQAQQEAIAQLGKEGVAAILGMAAPLLAAPRE